MFAPFYLRGGPLQTIPDWLRQEMIQQTMPQVFQKPPPVSLYPELPAADPAVLSTQLSPVEYATLESLGAPPPATLSEFGGNLAQYMSVHPL
ncbi:MAG TPA: hypothetical protein VF772_26215, partial [Terriglobales bacterium]